MKKLGKVIALTLALLMLAVVSAPMVSAADDEMVVAYVQVPQDWQEPCLWAWDADGNNAFDAWPGGEAEADPGNEGWYYCWIPEWVTSIIVNANEGEVQTSDFAVEGKNVWITVSSPEEVEVVYEPLTNGEAPAYVEKISVHAKVPESWTEANIWAWLNPDGTNAFATWPGEVMKLDDSGWYNAKVPAWINSIIINAGEGNPQTEDLTVEPKEMWIVVAEDGTAEVVYENPDQVAANITVRVKVPEDWQAPCLWAWSDPDGTNVFSAWPGEVLVADGEWLTLEVPGWINRVIVNANEGSIQTGDIEVEVGKDVWIVIADADTYQLTYEEPESNISVPQKKSPMPWIIVGIAVAVVAAALIVVMVVRKKKKS